MGIHARLNRAEVKAEKSGRVGQLSKRLLKQGPPPEMHRESSAKRVLLVLLSSCLARRVGRLDSEPGKWLQLAMPTVPWEEHNIPFRTKQLDVEAAPKHKEEPTVDLCL